MTTLKQLLVEDVAAHAPTSTDAIWQRLGKRLYKDRNSFTTCLGNLRRAEHLAQDEQRRYVPGSKPWVSVRSTVIAELRVASVAEQRAPANDGATRAKPGFRPTAEDAIELEASERALKALDTWRRRAMAAKALAPLAALLGAEELARAAAATR